MCVSAETHHFALVMFNRIRRRQNIGACVVLNDCVGIKWVPRRNRADAIQPPNLSLRDEARRSGPALAASHNSKPRCRLRRGASPSAWPSCRSC